MQIKAQTRSISLWLYTMCGLVFCMVVIGAITRLTESGLSMVEWRPLIGSIPPLSEAEWIRVFELYKETPEFQKKNFWMELEEFKTIFFWEWFHRFWGRLLGLAYGLPLIFFWVKGALPQGSKLKLLGLLILGGSQGVLGWWMVKSGLVDQPSVSHYRLAAHLSLAFVLFGSLLWMGLSLDPKVQKSKITFRPTLLSHLWIVTGSIILTIFWGAYVAGLDAGLIYNDTFPKMGKTWVPSDMWQYDPAWINFFETHAGVQFTHRWLAMLSVALILSLWFHAQKTKQTFAALNGLALMGLAQMGLGIWTLMSGVSLPIAAAHQAGALIIIALLVACFYKIYSSYKLLSSPP